MAAPPDIAAFRRRPDGSTTQALTGPAADGDTVAGPRKAAQWAVSQLFSREGIPFRPNDGTGFLHAISTGLLATDADVYATFAVAAARVVAAAGGRETADTPADERLRSVVLSRLTISPGTLTFAVTVRTAGARAGVTIPVTVDLTR